jgi:uncharacterized protein with HEPN domain
VPQSESQRLSDYLNHILEAIARIQSYTAGMTQDAFILSPITQDAVIRNVEIIGEACRNILKRHAAFAAAQTDIDWRSPYEMRNALAHGYFAIDLTITWTTVVNDLPPFANRIKTLLSALPSSEPNT